MRRALLALRDREKAKQILNNLVIPDQVHLLRWFTKGRYGEWLSLEFVSEDPGQFYLLEDDLTPPELYVDPVTSQVLWHSLDGPWT